VQSRPCATKSSDVCSPYGGFGTETLKILALNWRDISHPEAGGAEVDLREFFRVASRCGHEITLFTARYDGAARREDAAGYRIQRDGNRFTVYLAAVKAYRRELARGKFDVILDDINGVPWFTPFYVHEPVVALLNHLVRRTFFQELPLPLAALGWIAEASIPSVYRNVPIMVRTEMFRKELADAGYSTKNIHVVHSGLDHDTYRPGGEKAPVPTLIFVGPIKTYKHPEVALRVVAALAPYFPDLQLDIVGWDRNGLSVELIRLAKRLGIGDRVEFHGWLPENEKVALLQRAWALLQPSEREGWSYAVMEAAACGTPAVATAVGGMRESVHHGFTGFLVPYGDERAFGQAVRRIIADDGLRRRLSAGALEWARQFSWERYAREVLDVLGGAASQPSQR